jgi:hypothetical protein
MIDMRRLGLLAGIVAIALAAPSSALAGPGSHVGLVAHNDGGAPAISALLTVEDDVGTMLGQAGPFRIEPTISQTLTVGLPRDAIITSSGALRAGLTVRLRDKETGEQASFVTS